MISTQVRDTALEDVLRELTGAGMYRNNAFRVTGLATNASVAQVRRRREEAALAAQLGMPPAAASGELPLTPAPDWDVVRAAFESLRDPVVRLVHELLWLWGDDSDHDYAVRRHCGVLEGQSLVAPGRPDMPDDPVGQQWLVAIQAWADVLSSEEIWDWARRRVKEIDDPRLTTGTVRRLRDRLPQHIIEGILVLALQAAEELGPESSDRYLWLLDESTFDDDLIDATLRDVVRPAEARVRDACEAADNVSHSQPHDAIGAGHELMAQVRPQLWMIAGLLGPDDPVTSAIYDQVARAVNLCAVSYSNETSDNGPARNLLPHARWFAREHTTMDLIDKNMASISEELVTAMVEDLRKAGRVNAAADRLRAVRRHATDTTLRAHVDAVLANPLALRLPPSTLPLRGSLFGFGIYLWGHRSVGSGRYVANHYLTLLFIPVFPVAAYLRDATRIYGKVPMSILTRWCRLIAPLLLVTIVVQPLRDLPRLMLFLSLLLFLAGGLLWRWYRVDKWAAAQVARQKG